MLKKNGIFLVCIWLPCLLLFPGWLLAQNLIKGNVTDEAGEIIVGASVIIKGTTIGTVTDKDGNFILNLTPDQKNVMVSFIGYETTEITINGQRLIKVVLKAKDQGIGEVQVVGFGEQRKESVIGSISSVSVGNLKTPVGKVSSSLAGKMAGIVAVQRSGEPGAGADFWIRGVSTFGANNRPLVLVDGIERPLDLVEVEDIETFSILKDATATAVYGVRGANGVVLVTTRKGKEGKPAISIKAENGFLSPTRMPKMANAEQFIDLYNEVYSEANNGRLFYSEEDKQKYLNGTDPDLYPNVNWMDEIYKEMTTSRRVTANITGGTPMVRFYVSGSVYKENGIFNAEKGTQYNPSLDWTRYNFRSNVDINLHRTTVLNLSLSTQYDVKNKPDTDELWIYSFLTVPIAIPKAYSDGTVARPPIGQNPYNLLNNTGYVQMFNNNSQSLISLTQDFSELVTPGLKANVKFSWDAVNSATTSRYKSPSTYYATGRDEEGNLILQKNNDGTDYMSLWAGHTGERVTYLESSLTYENVFSEQHRVGGLILFNMRERINNFPVGNGTTSAYINSLPYRNVGIAGRATYSYKDTYFIEGNFGYNGSENFSPGKQLGLFPSLALGWLVSNENFIKAAFPNMNLLKLKGSWGAVGSDKIQAGERRFAFNTEMRENGAYTFGESGQNWIGGLGVGYPGNPNVSWERAEKLNLGLEYGIFNKLKIQFDYFSEKRDHIFIPRTSIASVTGIPVRPQVNLGRVNNNGWETSLEYDDKFGELVVSVKANVTFNRNKTRYDDNPAPIMDYKNVVNKPLYQQFGLIALGYFESEEDIANSPVQQYGPVRPGDIKFRDINGDRLVNDNDIVAIGRSHVPELNYGVGFSLGYHGFDLSLHFQGLSNFTNFMDGSPVNGFENANLFLSGMYADVVENRWTPENPDPNAKYPRMSIYTNQNNKQLSTKKQFDSSFIRLKNAEFGYTIPRRFTSKIGFSSMRFYLQGVNVFTWSKFKLWDPELNDSQGAVYPNMRVMNAGVNINL